MGDFDTFIHYPLIGALPLQLRTTRQSDLEREALIGGVFGTDSSGFVYLAPWYIDIIAALPTQVRSE